MMIKAQVYFMILKYIVLIINLKNLKIFLGIFTTKVLLIIGNINFK